MTDSPLTAADPAPIRLALDPADPEAGSRFTLTAEIDPDACPGATHLAILDADGAERARVPLMASESGPTADPVELTAPLASGEQVWLARLLSEAEGPEAQASVDVPFSLRLRAHPIGVVAWGMPAALSRGETFRVHVGLKCPCGCDSSGWRFVVTDGEGRTRAEGQVGDTPWPGTEGLRECEIALTAPEAEGTETWTVTAVVPDHPAPHLAGQAPLRLVTRPAPEVTITVVVTDAATGAPVPRAKVVAHPYRTLADDTGTAVLRVSKGRYRVQVSGKSYFAASTEGEVTEDVTITAALEVDREFTDADAWA